MHFIAMLGFTIPGQTTHYNVPVTILSLVVAVAIVCAGLLIVGFGPPGLRSLIPGGLVTGIGVAVMHYFGMSATGGVHAHRGHPGVVHAADRHAHDQRGEQRGTARAGW